MLPFTAPAETIAADRGVTLLLLSCYTLNAKRAVHFDGFIAPCQAGVFE